METSMSHLLTLAADDTAILVTEQLLVLATVVGSIAALPPLIQFILERSKRRERLELAIEDIELPRREAGVSQTQTPATVRLVGLDDLKADIADLVDRVKNPSRYTGLSLGNEVLIVGPEQSGRKSLAKWIAIEAGISRMLIVHNPRYSEALAAAKRAIKKARGGSIMLLIPNIDEIFDEPAPEEDEEIQAELDALIEAIASKPHVLVVGTAKRLAEGDDLDDLFGMKIMLPGAPPVASRASRPQPSSEHERFLRAVAMDAIDRAAAAGFAIDGQSQAEAAAKILARVANPAEIEDICEVARTTAIYRKHQGEAAGLSITPAVLEKATRRVMGH